MNPWKAILPLLLLLAAPAADAANVTLLYNGSVRAELHDCGCKTDPLGGLARRAALVGNICADGREVLLVDAGNLFGDPTQDTLARSRFVAAQTAAMGYSAVGVGPYEFGHGIEAVQEVAQDTDMAFLSANLMVGDTHPFQPWTVVERGGVRFGLISVVDPAWATAPYDGKVDGLSIEDPAAALARELPRLREQCDVVVLLSNMKTSDGTVDLLRALDGGPAVEFVVEGSVDRQYKNPRHLGHSYVLAANARGKYLGQADLTIDGGRVVDVQGEVHRIEPRMEEKESVARAVARFEESQEELARSR